MIEDLSSVISNEAKKLLQASEKDDSLSESQLEALEALCRCAKALKANEKEDPPDDLEDESDEELLGKVGLPTGGTPGCAGGVKYGDKVTCASSEVPHGFMPERCDSPRPAWPKGVCVCKHQSSSHSRLHRNPYTNTDTWLACVDDGCGCPFFRQGDEVTAMLLTTPTQT